MLEVAELGDPSELVEVSGEVRVLRHSAGDTGETSTSKVEGFCDPTEDQEDKLSRVASSCYKYHSNHHLALLQVDAQLLTSTFLKLYFGRIVAVNEVSARHYRNHKSGSDSIPLHCSFSRCPMRGGT